MLKNLEAVIQPGECSTGPLPLVLYIHKSLAIVYRSGTEYSTTMKTPYKHFIHLPSGVKYHDHFRIVYNIIVTHPSVPSNRTRPAIRFRQ